MSDKLKALIIARQDIHAMAFNYFYEGWKYRTPSEGYDAVAKDCSEAANRAVDEFERLVKEVHDENTDNK